MKKPTKSSLTNKLDKECSRIVRSKGKCQICWKDDYDKLQCCHIYSRTYRNTRWDLLNLVCLCASCHFSSHKNPISFMEFAKEHLGDHGLVTLKQRHNVIKRWTIIEMQELLETLKGI